MAEVTKPRNPEDDWKFWMVVNPSTWIMPSLFAVLIIVLMVHSYVVPLMKPFG